MNFVSDVCFETADPVAEAQRVIEQLKTSSVVRMTPEVDLGDLRSFYDELIDHVGDPVAIGEDFTAGGRPTGERWLEIRYDADIPDMQAFRHSKNAQPLHTDESYIDKPADVMFFYCLAAAPSGGETVFVSNAALVERMERDKPALLESLRTVTLTYSKATNSRTRAVVLAGDPVPSFNFNYFCIDHSQSEEAIALNQDFHDYLQAEVVGSDLVVEVPLKPGEAVAWWDHHVLHGRNSFEATETNDRFIWKAGMHFPKAMTSSLA